MKGNTMSNVTVDGVEYTPVAESEGLKIAILQRGWVMIGQFSRDGSNCFLRDASVIRIWGTTKGIGEIAMGGPTLKTVLDPCGLVQFDYLTVVALVDADEKAWATAGK